MRTRQGRNGQYNGGGLHPMQRNRAVTLPRRILLGLTSLFRAEHISNADRTPGLDGDVWYATDHVYPNHWPHSDVGAAPLPLAKRRRPLKESLKARVDGEFLAGVLIVALAYALYMYVHMVKPEEPVKPAWSYYTES